MQRRAKSGAATHTIRRGQPAAAVPGPRMRVPLPRQVRHFHPGVPLEGPRDAAAPQKHGADISQPDLEARG